MSAVISHRLRGLDERIALKSSIDVCSNPIDVKARMQEPRLCCMLV